MAGAVALSSDGSRLAFVGGPRRQIYVRSMDQLAASPIASTDNAALLSFSPDGQWISYIAGDVLSSAPELMKIAVTGGPAQKLADAPGRVGPPTQSWGADGNILFNTEGNLLRISSNGGQVQTLATRDAARNERFYSDPHLLPDGNNVLVTINIGTSGLDNILNIRIVAFNLQTHEKKVLLDQVGVGSAQFVPSEPGSLYGHLVFYDAATSSLFGAPFDVRQLEVKGPAVPVINGIRGTLGNFGAFSISDSGTLAYVPGASSLSAARTLVWVDRWGVETPTAVPISKYNSPSLSPDGERVAVEIQDRAGPASDIWVCDLVRNTRSRITSEGSNLGPVWTPDGKRVIFASGTNLSKTVLASAPADSSSPPSAIAEDAKPLLPTSVSPDGENVILILNVVARWANDVLVMPLSTRSLRLFLTSRFRKSSVVFSPDGHWVAYASMDSGRSEIYVTAYPGPGATTPISDQGGAFPRWSRDGRELFYRNGVKMIAVDVQIGPTFRAGVSHVLFEGSSDYSYDVAPDGKRFLMIKNTGSAQPSQPDQLHIIVNWVEELMARVRPQQDEAHR